MRIVRVLTRRRLSLLTIVASLAAPLAVQAQDVTSNLKGGWILTETSGTTAVDSSTTANNGTYQNGVTLAGSSAVPIGGAVAAVFDGSNDYVSVPNESNYDITGSITVAAWIKVTAFDKVWQAIFTKGDTAWRLSRNNNLNTIHFACNGLSTNQLNSATSVNDGQWHHVVGVYDGSTLKLYIDGVLDASANSTGSIATNNFPVEIGRNNEQTGREWHGALYDARVYNRALTAADVSYLYLQGGPIGYWKLNQTSGTTAADSSGLAHSGTVTGGASWTTDCSGAGVFDFDGTTQYVSVPNATIFQPTSALTICAWVRGNAWGSGGDVDVIIRKGDSSPNNYELAIADGKVALALDDSDTGGIRSITSLSTGTWYHVVGTWDGATVKIYINGKLDSSTARTGTIGTDTRPVYIGGRTGSTDMFDGMMRDVRFYNRALSASEVSTLYGVLGDWKLNETSGTTAADASGMSHNGTVSGGASWSTDCSGTGVFDFNGSTQYISTPNDTSLQPKSGLTIEAWVRGDSWSYTASEVNTILRKGEGNPNNYQLAISNGQVTLYLDQNDDQGVRSTTVLSPGRWYHVAATWDGATVKIYINGELDTSAARTGTIATDTRPLYIGGRSGADLFNGMIRNVRFLNHALCPSEIAAEYGLIGQWKLNASSGTTAADSSAYALNGTVSGTPHWSTRCNGVGVFDFDGSSNYVSVPNAANLQPTAALTIAAWVKLDTFGSGGDVDVIIRKGDSTPNNYELAIADGKVSLNLDDSDTAGIRGNTVLTAGTWYHVAATWNGSTVSIYVNGQLDNTPVTRTGTIGTDTRPMYIGGRTGGTDMLDGMIYDVQFYSRALCPTEIAQLYGLVGYWKLDETSGTAAADSSGLGRSGTVVGTATWTTGKIGNSLQLDGNTHMEVASLMDSPKNVTLSAWANLTTADSSGAEVISLGDCLAIRLNSGTTSQAFFYNGSTWTAISKNQTFTAGWHHFATVFDDDNDSFTFYVDGAQAATTSTTSSISYSGLGTKTVLGTHGNGQTTMDFTGKIDDARVYNRALCPTEVQQLFSSGGPGGVTITKWVEMQ